MFSSVLHVKNLFFVTLLENGGEYWSVREREKQRDMCNGRETGVKYMFSNLKESEYLKEISADEIIILN
jgi:hypothetical protein